MTNDDTLRMGQVAKLFNVAPRSIAKWFDAGLFPGGFRLPGSGDRRVSRAAVEAFAAAHGFPLNGTVPPPVEPTLPLAAVERLLAETTLPAGVVRRLLVAAGLSAEEAGRMVEGALAKGVTP